MSPPTTITAGFEEVDGAREDLAERPAGVADHANRARVAAPDEADDVAALRGVDASAPRDRSASAWPPAIASRQPMFPHRQMTSSLPATRMWPMSPAAPRAPRWMWPSATIPQPMPVPTLIRSRCFVSRQCIRCSPRAMMLTSLSTRTGAW
jgi:hypothetical protein